MSRREIGQWGESTASIYLQKKGFTILETNYTSRSGEVDIIAFDREFGQLVFVEVKTRIGYVCGFPEQSVTSRKRRRMHKSAMHYIRYNSLEDDNYRFDIVSIVILRQRKVAKIRHLRAILGVG